MAWELHIEGVGVTQSHTLWDAEEMARDLIARRAGSCERSRSGTATGSRAVTGHGTAAAPSWLVRRDIAKVLNVSPQRVSQLLRTGT
jgi:hypothetical protein